MNSNLFKRWLAKQGCTFETSARSGHIEVFRGKRRTTLPMHGGRKQLGVGLRERIKKDLGLK